jgi:hypothetical protein
MLITETVRKEVPKIPTYSVSSTQQKVDIWICCGVICQNTICPPSFSKIWNAEGHQKPIRQLISILKAKE